MSLISSNLQAVQHEIATVARSTSCRADEITLLAVSKTFGVEQVLLAADAGQRAFGENYLQEALEKIALVRQLRPELMLEWHFIGPIQSNKTRPIAESFDWVHSVERLKIAQRLSEQRPASMPALNVCLQVNISGEASKSGVAAAEVVELARAVALLPRLKLRGLMAIPEPSTDPVVQRAAFHRVQLLMAQCHAAGLDMDTLSMGMSADMDAAIAEGATIVRVGTAIFGARTYAK
ncbi:pyridoxal phosphate enzyme (YggS family) [Actimicrobium sp. GrIS 1.19]|uniref:YggS family pyridoxal phosphate-dependent enzyme n=1 Tax=Actimicrobium sp. GrIS 1.19 TaxID=3071708 RepID=UPI002E03A099|nr:pyridoxal phosphate enzyme (YggS family) [Actimicrobium sp. GrIS 1.19]